MPRSNGLLRRLLSVILALAAGEVACRAEESPRAAAGVPSPHLTPDREPDAVDLQPNFRNWGLPPRVQGKRGTCSVFVVIGAMEYALAARQACGTRLSVEFLNWASNQVAKDRDDGGFFSDLWKGYLAYGVCPEEEMPYREHFDPGAQPGKKGLERAKDFQNRLEIHWIKQWDPSKGLNADQFAEVKQTLAWQRPVCCGMLWPKKEEWKEGVLQMCPRDRVRDGHSVLVVGYRDDPRQPGGGVLLIRNSSGPSREGALSYAYARAYTNDAVWIDPVAARAGGSSPPRKP